MVRWIIDNVEILDRALKNSRHEVMGSFTLDNLRIMYHLPEPLNIYDKAFNENFMKENEDWMDAMQTWRSGSNKFKREKFGINLISPLSSPHSFASAMMCRLFGKADNTKIFIKWIPLIDATINATIMN